MTWTWIPAAKVVEWHERLIERYGGASGLRDPGSLESALARARNAVAYGDAVSTERLAAVLAVGVVKAHAFVDGNKRIAFAVMVTFLRLHDRALDVSEAEATRVTLAIAAGEWGDAELAGWLEGRTVPTIG